jgi:hypothetical protein
MASAVESLVSKSCQMSVPARVRRRWGLTEGGLWQQAPASRVAH